jgi:hypothetical protein
MRVDDVVAVVLVIASSSWLSEGRQGTEPMLTICRYPSTYCVELGEPERWGKHLDREGNAMRDTWT